MSKWYVYASAALLTLTAGYACWCRAPLIWDGSFQFARTLVEQHPFVYMSRFHSYFLWYPTVWASHVTNNLLVLESVYGLPFLLAPVAGLMVSWWIVRPHAPHLIIWPLLGVAAAPLPGQIFVINDSIFQLHLFWPLFMGLLVPLNRRRRWVLAALAVFQFIHPIGVLLMGVGVVAAGLIALADHHRWRRLLMGAGIMAALCGLAVLKIVLTNHFPPWNDVYAHQEATVSRMLLRYASAVWGAPIDGLLWMWLAGVLIFAHPLLKRRPAIAATAGALALLCVIRGGFYWIAWAHGPITNWRNAIDYRRWVGPLSMPFFILAALETFVAAWNREHHPARADTVDFPKTRVRGPLALLVAAVFGLVLGSQCRAWAAGTDRLLACLRNYPSALVPNDAPSLAWTRGTPMCHWTSSDLVMSLQGMTPRKLLLDRRDIQTLRTSPCDLVDWHYNYRPSEFPRPGGWFDLRPVLQDFARERPVGADRGN